MAASPPFDVSAFEAGAIHAPAARTAGKSTLGKIMLGVETPDEGALSWDGDVRFTSPVQANLPGWWNFTGIPPCSTDRFWTICPSAETCIGPFVDHGATLRQAQQVMDQFEMPLDMRAMVGDLPAADRQRMEICVRSIRTPT